MGDVMHYYKFSIGDYAAATRHLSMLEHGAYRLLLDLYYTSEQPIPLDLKAAARKAGARTKDEVQAVETILREFFTETEGGWSHARCDSEIAAFKAKTETNRAVGRLGGRPKKETQTVSDGNPEKTQTVSENNPQETLTTNQEPLTIIKTPAAATRAEIFAVDSEQKPEPENPAFAKIQGWQPGQEAINAIRMQNVPPEFIAEQLPEFRTYWATQPHAPPYDPKFVKSVLGNWKRSGHSWQPGMAKTDQQRKASVFDLSRQNYASGDL